MTAWCARCPRRVVGHPLRPVVKVLVAWGLVYIGASLSVVLCMIGASGLCGGREAPCRSQASR